MLPISLRQRRDAVTTEEDRAPLFSEVKRPASDVRPSRVFYSDVAVKLTGSDTWVNAQ
jgi:hypothetical protein